MTSPESPARPEYASQVQLTSLYKTLARNAIAKGMEQPHRLGMATHVVVDPNSPYPPGVNFQRTLTGFQLKTTGIPELIDVVDRRQLNKITFQFMTEIEAIDEVVDRVEHVPATMAIIAQHDAGHSDVFWLENRNVDGSWVKVTDKPEASANPADYCPDDINFTVGETADLQLLAQAMRLFPGEGQPDL